MKDVLEYWFREIPALPGLLACGVRFPDRHCLSQSHAPDFPPLQLETLWHLLAEVVPALNQHRIAATRLRWSYARAEVYFAARADGIALGILATPELPVEIAEEWLEQFLELGHPLPAPALQQAP